MNRPLSLFRLNQGALSACAAIRIETLGKLINHKFTAPLPDFHLSDWDALLRLLKVKMKLG